jgi:hypothetical protein
MSAGLAPPQAGAPLVRARSEMQNAVQWLARLAQSYAAPLGDGSLHWEVERSVVRTGALARGITAELHLPTLCLQFAEQGRASPHPLALDGKSSSEVEAWVLVELLHRGFDRNRFVMRLLYLWPDMMTGDQPKYAATTLAGELAALTALYNEATEVIIAAVQCADQADRPDLVCWPDLFDIGMALRLAGGRGGQVEVRFTTGSAGELRPAYFARRTVEGIGTPARLDGGVMPQGRSAAEIVAQLSEQITAAWSEMPS